MSDERLAGAGHARGWRLLTADETCRHRHGMGVWMVECPLPLNHDGDHVSDVSRVEVAAALADIVSRCYDYGDQGDGFVAAYVAPPGPIHRAIRVLQRVGITARPMPTEHMPPRLQGLFPPTPTAEETR